MDDGVLENTDTIIFVPSLILFVNPPSIIFYCLSEKNNDHFKLEIDFGTWIILEQN